MTGSLTGSLARRDTASFVAIQRTVGASSGIDPGKLMAPALAACGTQAIVAAAFLGIPLEQYVTLQHSKGGAAQLFALASRSMQQFGPGAMGAEIGLQTLAGLGIIDPSGLKSDQALSLAETMQRTGATAVRAHLQQATQAAARTQVKAQTFREQERRQGAANQGLWEQLGNLWGVTRTGAGGAGPGRRMRRPARRHGCIAGSILRTDGAGE